MATVSTRDTAATTNAVETHGWIDTETVKTRLGGYEFKGGYPTDESARKLAEQLVYNRAVEAFLSQMPVVSWYHVWQGVARAGAGTPNQMVIWESLMDAQTLLLTGNTETVYGLCSIDLKRDGPTVIEVPPNMKRVNVGTTGDDHDSLRIGLKPSRQGQRGCKVGGHEPSGCIRRQRRHVDGILRGNRENDRNTGEQLPQRIGGESQRD